MREHINSIHDVRPSDGLTRIQQELERCRDLLSSAEHTTQLLTQCAPEVLDVAESVSLASMLRSAADQIDEYEVQLCMRLGLVLPKVRAPVEP